jgi:hypothetical protein
MPAPSIEPAVIPPEDRPEMSTVPPALAMKRAWPRVLMVSNNVIPPVLVVMVALPAVLVPEKHISPLLVTVALPAVLELKNPVNPRSPLIMTALPAVLEFRNSVNPNSLLKIVGRFEELLTMPAPVSVKPTGPAGLAGLTEISKE